MRYNIVSLVFGTVVALAGSAARAQEPAAETLKAVQALTAHDVRALIDEAVTGDAQAQLMVGLAYHHGYGAQQMPTEAVKWCRMAAEQGLAQAQHLLGKMYQEGEGVEQDVSEAAKWFRAAAEQGFAEAQYDYGLLFLDGVGVPQDNSEAFKWFNLAAEQGSLGGQTFLGVMYVNGLGVPQNASEGLRHLGEAARRGSPMAQANLGALYANGVGVEQDNAEALTWLIVAEAGGFEGVQPLIDGLRSQMPVEEVTIAELRAEALFEELSGDRATASVGPGSMGPVDLSQVFETPDEPPEKIYCPALVYPRAMQQAGIQGSVLIEFIIDTEGHVPRRSVRVVKSNNGAFDYAARSMVAQCLFRPGRVRGQPVRVLMRWPLIFRIRWPAGPAVHDAPFGHPQRDR